MYRSDREHISRTIIAIIYLLKSYECVHVVFDHYVNYPHTLIGQVWINRLLFMCVFVFCICTVTDFSAEDKASGVKSCSAVHRCSRQGISHFGELILTGNATCALLN